MYITWLGKKSLRPLTLPAHSRSSGERRMTWKFVLMLLAGSSCVTVTLAQDQSRDAQKTKTSQPSQSSAKELKYFWKDTLRIESPDKNFRLKLGGRVQWDWSIYDARDGIEELGDFDDDTEFRRGRVYYSGSLDNRFELT